MNEDAIAWRERINRAVRWLTRDRVRGTCNDLRWWWTPWTDRFAHGGWIFLSARWFWRFRNGVPR
jgi:hypothetical protein